MKLICKHKDLKHLSCKLRGGVLSKSKYCDFAENCPYFKEEQPKPKIKKEKE